MTFSATVIGTGKIKDNKKRSLYQAPRSWGKRIVKSYRKTEGGREWLGTDGVVEPVSS